ncbi:MAG: phosphotransferase [Ardenticatenaceae bacterium]
MSELLRGLVGQVTGQSEGAVRLALRPALAHQSNRLYDVWAGGLRLIAKEYLKADEFEDAPRREFGALELLAPLDIAPRPVFCQLSPTSALGPVVIYEWMDGEMWNRRRPTAANLFELATLWLQTHEVPVDGMWMSRWRPLPEILASFSACLQVYGDWVEFNFPRGNRIVELCLDLLDGCGAVAEELDDYDPSLCFCRSDPRFANVIARPDGRLGLVDWEDCGLRDPALDLADLLTGPNQEDLLLPDEWQAFLQPYLAARSVSDPHLARRTHLYAFLFPMFWLSLFLQQGAQLAESGQLVG